MDWIHFYLSSVRAMLMLAFMILTVVQVRGYSLDKQILDSAPKAEMFDLFHVMPNGEVKVMTELDLLLSLDQYKRLHTKTTTSNRSKRKAARSVAHKWPNCIVYYEIAESLSSAEDRRVIKLAMQEWEKYTCLVFKERHDHHHRIIFQDGGGCYSELGMQQTPQVLTLARGCRTVGTITHEIGHAIGWYHEHMRPDRDEYVVINDKAVPMKYKHHYVKYESDVIHTHGIPYDYTSIMHYGNDAFPGSIITHDPKYQDKIGQREGLSFKDIKLANLMYKCAEVMACLPKQCEHNGFVLYKDFKEAGRCECWCDSGNIHDPLVLCSSIDRGVENPKPSPPPIDVDVPVVHLCYDVREDCKEMKGQGMCMSRMDLMMDACAKTCDICGKGENLCMDHDKGCGIMAASGACTEPGLKKVLSSLCPASCGLCSKPPDPCEIQYELLGSSRDENDGVRVVAPFWVWISIATISIKLLL